MPQIRRTRESRRDYDDIWYYIALRDVAAADRLSLHLDATLQTIVTAPQIGRNVEELAPNLRCFPVGNYLIFYRPFSNGIELIRLLHGARDITPDFFVEN